MLNPSGVSRCVKHAAAAKLQKMIAGAAAL
jgi:hypothetical protein